MIKWSPPPQAHGNLTKYIIKCEIVNESTQLLEQRNYCNERKFSPCFDTLKKIHENIAEQIN